MSEKRDQTGAPEEPVALPEVRAARELREALEGAEASDSGAREALDAAAKLRASANPELSDEVQSRIGDELFGAAPKARRPRWEAAALVAAAVTVALGAALVARPWLRHADDAGGVRREAEALVAQLLPPGESAAARADRIGADAWTLYQNLRERE